MSLHHLIPLVQDYLDAETLLQRSVKTPAIHSAQIAKLGEVRRRLENYVRTAPHDDVVHFLLDSACRYLEATDRLEQARSTGAGEEESAVRLNSAEAELQDRLYRSVRNLQPEGNYHARRILIAVKDKYDSDTALYTAIHLAETGPTKLKLLHVMRKNDSDVTCDLQDLMPDANAMLARKQIEVPGDIECDCLVRHGDPAHCIISTARRWAADFIILGSHNGNHLNPAPLPDTVEAVLKHATCPVIVAAMPTPRIDTATVGTRINAGVA